MKNTLYRKGHHAIAHSAYHNLLFPHNVSPNKKN